MTGAASEKAATRHLLAWHGVAIMAVREGLSFESSIESDCPPLLEAVLVLLEARVDVRFLHDATRGGLATALVETATDAKARVCIEERAVEVPRAHAVSTGARRIAPSWTTSPALSR